MSTPVENLVQRVNAKPSGNGWTAKCPAHNDRNPSLSITEGSDGRALVKCHAGCEYTAILDALGMKPHDLFPATAQPTPKVPPAPAKSAEAAALANAPEVTPRPLGGLLDAVEGFLRRFVVFPLREQARVISLWVVHAWLLRAFDYTPYLNVWAASKRSGKSRVLEVLEMLCPNPELTQSGSSAALIRSIDEANPPTFLLDEIDSVFKGKNDSEAENTRRFLNAGFKRGAKFLRCAGQGADLTPKKLPAFCPKAFAGIGRSLPDTVADRSLPIELQRQSRSERAERFREREAKKAVERIRAELGALAQQSGVIDALKDARPNLPEELNDRLQDICEPLLAIADRAGGEWPEKARAALVRLCGQEEDTDIGVRLLAAIKSVFDEKQDDKLTTQNIIETLVTKEDGPWALMFEDLLKHNKLQTAASRLARMLRDYKRPDGERLKPHTVRVGDETSKGFCRADFEAEWERYFPPPPERAVTSVTSVTYEGKNVTAAPNVTADLQKGVTRSSLVKDPDVTAVTAVTASRNRETKEPEITVMGTPFTDKEGTKLFKYPDGTIWKRTELPAKYFEPLGPIVFEVDWIKHNPKAACPNSAHQWLYDSFPVNPECEVCSEQRTEDHWWFNRKTHAVNCPDCREAHWWADGYEIDEYGGPSCWDARHTREQRIAERERNFLQKHQRYALKHPDLARVLPDYDQEIARLTAIIDGRSAAESEPYIDACTAMK